jgi:phospholipid/cholesterol/gamma-HCH transport system ATP-binding protein
MTAPGESMIMVSHLNKSFGDHKVLDDFNLHLHKGENIVVLGKSGCGKSVLIKCIVGLLEFEGGSIRLFDQDITTLTTDALDELRGKIGFVFQSGALYDSMTVRENLEFPLRRHGRQKTKEEIAELINVTLGNVGLANTAEMMPAELSGGMRKRISLARALVLNPDIMLYDEPTTGLDPITAREIIQLMHEMQVKYDTSSIIISHDMHCAEKLSDKVIVMVNGTNYAEGSFNEVSRKKDPQVQSFFE